MLKYIPGYEGLYSVTDSGVVSSHPRKISREGRGEITTKLKVLKPNVDKDGYRAVTLYRNKTPKTLKVHRLVMLSFVGESELLVNHKDLDKSNNRLENLEYVTVAENNKHSRENQHHNMPRGENHPGNKLSDGDRLWINSMFANKVGRKGIAEIFGIHDMYVYKVVSKCQL